jgi:hypothetical protein
LSCSFLDCLIPFELIKREFCTASAIPVQRCISSSYLLAYFKHCFLPLSATATTVITPHSSVYHNYIHREREAEDVFIFPLWSRSTSTSTMRSSTI